MSLEELLILGSGILLCFMMNWGIGANDLANVMSTTIGSKAISVKQAIVIAIIFEFAGAFFGGSGVTHTMRSGIIDVQSLGMHQPMSLVYGMLSVLLACTLWMNLASFFGVPVSITNALVGSMVGFGAMVYGVDAIKWRHVNQIAISWVSSPLMSGTMSYLLFVSIQQKIFATIDPLSRAKVMMPIYLMLNGTVLSFITIYKGMKHFHINLIWYINLFVFCLSSVVIAAIGKLIINSIHEPVNIRRKDKFIQVEKYFAVLMALTSCAMVFAHGSNDVALAIGPLSVIQNLVIHPGEPINTAPYSSWTILLGCLGVIAGFLCYGKKVIETVGSSITALTPSRAFAATFSAAFTVVIANSLGIPVSATQTLVGAVLGVGLARGIGALNRSVIRNIFMSWILTLPVASLLTVGSYKLLTDFFNVAII